MTENRKVIWEEPPPSGRASSSGKWRWFADELRANPGRWARFPGVGLPDKKGYWTGYEFAKRGKVTYARFPEPEAPKRDAPSMVRRNPTIHALPSLVDELDRADRRRVGGVR